MNATAEKIVAPESITEYAEGIHENVPAELYHHKELGVVNKSALDQLARTPQHYRAWLAGNEQHETPALLFGRALHALVLEPAKFAREYVKQPVFGDLRTKAAKELRNDWMASHCGVMPVSSEEWEKLQAMRDAIMSHAIAGPLFAGGQAEATAIWTDPRTGLICKSRMDYWRPDLCVIADLKSTEDASPSAFARSVVSYRYHVQQAHYTSGPQALGLGTSKFVFVGIEKLPPYAVGVYMLDADAEARGHELRDRNMDTLTECLQTDTWPGLPPIVNTLSLPAYAFHD